MSSAAGARGTYSYALPAWLAGMAGIGAYVRVQLGPRERIGVVWSDPRPLSDYPKPEKLKPVLEVFEASPMPDLQGSHRLGRRVYGFTARCGFAPGFAGAGGLGPGAGENRIQGHCGTTCEIDTAAPAGVGVCRRGPAWSATDLARRAGVSPAVVTGLVKAGALQPISLPASEPFGSPKIQAASVKLNTGQKQAAQKLRQAVAARAFSVTLIDGVTGSGKTEVYFEAMAAALANGKQVLLLLPEIALTGQFITRVEARFGVKPGEWHSGVRPRSVSGSGGQFHVTT